MNDNLKPFPPKVTEQFLLSLLRKIPQLILKGKVDLSKYYFAIKAYEHHKLYLWYRYKHRFRWRLFHTEPPMALSESEFIATFCQPDEDDLYAASLTAIILSIEEVFPEPNLVYDSSGYYHQIGTASNCVERLHKLVKTRLYSPKTPDKSDLHDDIYQILERETELKPEYFYHFIFQQIKQAGLDWRFRSDYLQFIKHRDEGLNSPPSHFTNEEDDQNKDKGEEEDEIDYDFILSKDDPDENEHRARYDDLNFESAYFEELNEEAPASVVAYLQVYGQLPDGYPPRLDEY